jgi:hypothetical protein
MHAARTSRHNAVDTEDTAKELPLFVNIGIWNSTQSAELSLEPGQTLSAGDELQPAALAAWRLGEKDAAAGQLSAAMASHDRAYCCILIVVNIWSLMAGLIIAVSRSARASSCSLWQGHYLEPAMCVPLEGSEYQAQHERWVISMTAVLSAAGC